MSLALLFLLLMRNMFRMLICPSSGACDLLVELFHGLYCSGSMCSGITLWFGCCGVVSVCSRNLQRTCALQMNQFQHVNIYVPAAVSTYMDSGKQCSTHRMNGGMLQ